jgi:nitrate/TMAO reductase-like tetraheme cytochrome c subunit
MACDKRARRAARGARTLGAMIQGVVLVTAFVAVVGGFILYFSADKLVGSRAGRIAMLFGVLLLPFVALLGGTSYAYKASSSTDFCLSCHEMGDHGRSLFVDDPTVLPAVHYQKRLIDRDYACFACHTDYALFGSFKTKLNGLRHVWVHYFGDPPDTFSLYQPYKNSNCLHCHDDARGYVESVAHRDRLDALFAEEQSCLSCHTQGHGLDRVREGALWLGG